MNSIPFRKFLLTSAGNPLNKFITCRNQFNSAHSLKNYYPNSSLKITTLPESTITADKPKDVFSGYIPLEKVVFKYSMSSGPGGQHVNHIKTKVQIRFKLAEADWIPEKIREKLLQTKKSQITKDGYWIIQSDKTRSQRMNRADVLQRLRCIIYEAADDTPKEPSPETLEKIRKRQEKANRERLRFKEFRSLRKQKGEEFELE